MTSSHLLRRAEPLLAVGLSAALFGACGDSTSSGATPAGSSSNDRDTARLKLTQCLRENGVDIPDDPGPGMSRDGRGGLSEADRQKRRQALEGPCKDLQQGAFGHRSEEERQEFQDAFQRFAQCMRQNGVDVPDPTAGGGSGGGVRMHELDRDDPDVQAAQEKCQSELPQRGGRRGVGAQ